MKPERSNRKIFSQQFVYYSFMYNFLQQNLAPRTIVTSIRLRYDAKTTGNKSLQ